MRAAIRAATTPGLCFQLFAPAPRYRQAENAGGRFLLALAMLWTIVTDSDRARRPPLARPLWC
eukprot:3346132-Pyramimonas_sp.AAC.1